MTAAPPTLPSFNARPRRCRILCEIWSAKQSPIKPVDSQILSSRAALSERKAHRSRLYFLLAHLAPLPGHAQLLTLGSRAAAAEESRLKAEEERWRQMEAAYQVRRVGAHTRLGSAASCVEPRALCPPFVGPIPPTRTLGRHGTTAVRPFTPRAASRPTDSRWQGVAPTGESASGLFHEHERLDRWRKVTVSETQRFGPSWRQYRPRLPSSRSYDYASVMHYKGVTTIPPGMPVRADRLSRGDVDGVSRLYGTVPRTTTVSTSTPSPITATTP